MTTDSLMRAAQYLRYGGPEVLNICTVPIPTFGDNEVLIRIRYSTVNRTDCGFLKADPFVVRLFAGLTKPRCTILGCEFAGDVVEIGKNISDFSIGDRVFGFKDDDFGFGGHAQFTAMSVTGLIAKIPNRLSYEQAAAGLEGSHYALFGVRAIDINPGQSVLINGGTGAIGSAAVQIMHSMGIDVTAVCGSAHVETVAALGAQTVLDYENDDFTQLDTQFDAVYDAVGKSTFGQCKHLLKPNGVYLSTELGPYCQNPILALTTSLLRGRRILFPIPRNDRADAEFIASLMRNDGFTPLIDRTYPLSDIVSAFNYVDSGVKIGNVIINVNE